MTAYDSICAALGWAFLLAGIVGIAYHLPRPRH